LLQGTPVLASATAVIVFAIVAIPALAFAVYLLVQDALVRIDSGELGLVIRRGRPTGRTLLPGTHFVRPFGRMSIQNYPARELSYRTTRDAVSEDDTNPTTDPPVGVVLGDRSHAEVCYTVRFRLDPDRLSDIHTRFGPEGVYSIVRDVTEQQVADGLAGGDITYELLFGTSRAQLQTNLHERIESALATHGFVVTFFGLREVDLGEIGEAIQAKARAQALAEQYEIAAESRRSRAAHDMEIAAMLADMPETALRYQQIEAWRSLVERWDGRIGIPGIVAGRGAAEPGAPDGGAA
jgi:regulator of protease activity HflC (stomatin/prohibitin superfamily)